MRFRNAIGKSTGAMRSAACFAKSPRFLVAALFLTSVIAARSEAQTISFPVYDPTTNSYLPSYDLDFDLAPPGLISAVQVGFLPGGPPQFDPPMATTLNIVNGGLIAAYTTVVSGRTLNINTGGSDTGEIDVYDTSQANLNGGNAGSFLGFNNSVITINGGGIYNAGGTVTLINGANLTDNNVEPR